MTLPVTLTVRGTLVPKTLEAARILHNDTAGSPQGIAAARSLGDLTHKVYAPCLRSPEAGATAGELLFLDVWCDAQSIGKFFSNPEVQRQGGTLFTQKDATVWAPARGAYSYHLPANRDRNQRFVGIIRAPIASAEKAIEIFASVDEKSVRNARLRGILSHELFIRAAAPGDASPLELLGIDVWSDYDGMAEHYADTTHVSVLGGAFTGPPATSVWEQAPGTWSEW